MKNVILDLCGGTGSWSKFYQEDDSYSVHIITLPDYDITTKEVQNYRVTLKPYGILAAPPCTMFSLARNEKTAKEKRNLEKAMLTVRGCLEVIWQSSYNQKLKFWALENPRGLLKLFLGNPVLTFDPFEYGDSYSKKTCLWGNFNEPKKAKVDYKIRGINFVKHTKKFEHLKQIPEGYKEKTGYSKREILRSMTPLGFAKQFYEANR